MVLLCPISLVPRGSVNANDGAVTYLRNTAVHGILHAHDRAPAAEPRNSAEPVRRWRYLHRVLPTKRKLKMLVYQLTELSPMRYVDYMYRMY